MSVLRHSQLTFDQNSSLTCSYPSKGIKFSSKPIPQQKSSIYKSKNELKWKIRVELENEKSLKNLLIRSLHPLRDGFMAYRLVEETHIALQPHSSG